MFALLTSAGVLSGPLHAQDSRPYAIDYGMNPSRHAWSGREIVFTDAMARASEFGQMRLGQYDLTAPPLIPFGEVPPRLGEGWPDPSFLASGSKPAARLFVNMAGTMPDGRVDPYVMTWEGTGSCRLVGTPVIGEQNRSLNRVEVSIDPTTEGGNGVLMWVLDASSELDPVRNVHIWLPGTEVTDRLFWPPYVGRVLAMNNGEGPHTWRTLNWSRVGDYGVSNSPVAFEFDYHGRIRPSSPSQGTRRGVCIEYQVAFCNRVGANLHLNVPHRTDDIPRPVYIAFLYNMFLRVRDGRPAAPNVNSGLPFAGLRDDLTVTVELSNEIWNAGFPVYHWMRARALARGVSVHQVIAEEIELVFDVARAAFDGPDAHRLRTYVAGWMGQDNFLAGILSNLRPDLHIDSMGVAAYFGPRPDVVSQWMQGANPSTGACPNCPNAQDVVQAGRASISEIASRLARNRLVIESWTNTDGSKPDFELYEGGQSFVAGFQPWAAAANAAQTHPDMYDAYVEDLVPTLVREGAKLVNWYSFMTNQDDQGGGGLGPFGIWDNMKQPLLLPVPEPYIDQMAPKAAAIYRGPPRVSAPGH